jgi:hypothetical protein
LQVVAKMPCVFFSLFKILYHETGNIFQLFNFKFHLKVVFLA